ncbi:DUF1697 domain-containing protein [Streptomyces roseoverticillatus]|uniref:DUF1697 domain-containing protein n=1 Tax=Streptomyces roseoverticillatus TaxID=66429 RepID=UPI001F1644D7|nr:DUF1697 domain-containing protein [Streptomyces roseoverticillatus]MCF3103652.1 DUF1697 domain-containing protein [Streptomyces roseoverticillatus]
MTTYVALLRGINVGGKKRVPMQTLRELLSGMGCGSVRTHLNSGNAVFTHPGADPDELARELERAIERELGFAVTCMVRDAGDIRRVVDADPFSGREVDPSRYVVTFLAGPAGPATVADVDPAAYAPEEFVLAGRELYVYYAEGIRDAKLAKVLTERRLGTAGTGRNWNTVTKLAAMAQETQQTEETAAAGE